MENEALNKQDQQKNEVSLKSAKFSEFFTKHAKEILSLINQGIEKNRKGDVAGSLSELSTIMSIVGEMTFAAGKLQVEEGSWNDGVRSLRRSRDLFVELGDWRRQAQASVEIGDAHLMMGDYEVAKMSYLDAQRYLRKIADEAGLAVVQQKLGALALFMYQADEAETQLKKAIAFFESHNDQKRAEVSRQLLQLAPEVRQTIPA